MSAPAGALPFLSAWLEAQQAFARMAAGGVAFDPGASTTHQLFAAQYQRLFNFQGPALVTQDLPGTGPALQRYQRAAERFGSLLAEAAADAGRRLGEALARGGPDVPPVTTWRELHALWIDCGEAAWSKVAHREDFATAQAELLAALVALRAPGPPA